MCKWGKNQVQQSVKTHHASGPAVHHLCQSKLELPYKLLSCLWYPTLPLQLSDTLGHGQHPINGLKEELRDREEERNRWGRVS